MNALNHRFRFDEVFRIAKCNIAIWFRFILILIPQVITEEFLTTKESKENEYIAIIFQFHSHRFHSIY